MTDASAPDLVVDRITNVTLINGVTPEALAGNVLINGEPVSGNGEFNLQSSLQNADRQRCKNIRQQFRRHDVLLLLDIP